MLNKENFRELFLDKLNTTSGVSLEEASPYDIYISLSSLVKDMLMKKWVDTNNRYLQNQEKQVFYFSLEFLLGKMLETSLIYLEMRKYFEDGLMELGIRLEDILESEPDPGLGNGGLGRLAACFLDSLSSMGFPGHGCGIRYKHGLFQQKIIDGYQVELPDNWLKEQSVWEVRKGNKAITVKLGGSVRNELKGDRVIFIHENYEAILAVPYDIPIPGYRNETVNTLRLWKAEAIQDGFDFNSFSRGEYIKAVEYNYTVEAISEILYPDDSNYSNKILRLKQQYFFVSAGLQSIVRRYKKKNGSICNFSEKIAIHINDTHPAIAVPELMRILIDEEELGWEDAWNITTNTISYTNHTIMPEALEKWPVEIFKTLLPRIWMIINEINEQLCKRLWTCYTGQWDKISRMAVVSDGFIKMANLAIVGSYSVNGVAAIHTKILKNELFKDFNEYEPFKFNNKTNGITHRRWLLKSNPKLAELILNTIGGEWLESPKALEKLGDDKYIKDTSFLNTLQSIKTINKIRLAKYIKDKCDIIVDPYSLYDVQVKRIHAYKRQLLKVFHVLDLYYRLLDNPSLDIIPKTFIFSGKAAPSYYYAKSVIKFINSVADMVNSDKRINNLLKVVFLENYSVSLAEIIFPASDLSEQISTASTEASGTGNMKFMMNGAVTIGTMDGANIEIMEAVGKDNMFLFGLQVDDVLQYHKNGGYLSWDIYNNDNRVKTIMDNIQNGHIHSRKDEFRNIYTSLLDYNDEFFVLKDFASYIEVQNRVEETYRNTYKWLGMSAANIAKSGRFSSDETISQYAADIWKINKVKPKNQIHQIQIRA